MINELEFRIAELERKLNTMIFLGKIKELDCAKARVIVESGNISTDWLPWLTRRAGSDIDWWAPEVEEQVMVVCPCGDPALGVVLPSIYCSKYFPENRNNDIKSITFLDGASGEYNRKTNTLTIDVPGTITINTSSLVNCTAPEVKIKGNVDIQGPVKITGSFSQLGGGAEFGSTVKAVGAISSLTSVSSSIIKSNGIELTKHKHNTPKGVTSAPI